jgi:ribosomal peptide maturation radical SAM protein 1
MPLMKPINRSEGNSTENDISQVKILLIEMPFKSVSRPTIGLSLLKSVLEEGGYTCNLRYANIEFADFIGYELFETIAELLPHEYLIGDLIFSPQISSFNKNNLSQAYPEVKGRQLSLSSVPEWFWDCLPDLQEKAKAFVDHLTEEICESKYNVFGFNLMFQATPSLALSKSLKCVSPEKWIIFGGANCEGEMGLTLHQAFPWVDFVCRGEGENVILELVKFLEGKGKGITTIQGLIWREENQSICNGERAKRVENLDALPTPKYHDWLRTFQDYFPDTNSNELAISLETSRGCWYGQINHCIFCGLNGESLAFRCKSGDKVISELNEAKKYNIKNVFNVDLIFPKQYFTTLLPRLAENNLGLSLFYEIKANLSKDQLRLLKAAGVNHLQPGIENLNSELLNKLKKGISAYQNIRLLKWAAEIGITLDWNLLYGIPGEEAIHYQEMAELIPLLYHLRPPTCGCSKIRIDRFSPLHSNPNSYGISSLCPSIGYSMVYDLPEEKLKKLAYFFEYRSVTNPNTKKWVSRVERAVQEWHATKGEETFLSLDVEEKLILFDRRQIAVRSKEEIEGLERKVFLACDGGETLGALIKRVGESEKRIMEILEKFAESKWVTNLDNRYLSLPIKIDPIFVKNVPEGILGSVCHAIFKSRMQAMWGTIDSYKKTFNVVERGSGRILKNKSTVNSV